VAREGSISPNWSELVSVPHALEADPVLMLMLKQLLADLSAVPPASTFGA
jgi:hypothetical protein